MRSGDFSDDGALAFYRRATSAGTSHLTPMIALVERLRSRNWSRGMPYFISHDWLCIGDSLPGVAVTHKREGHFEVQYSTRARQNAVAQRVPEVGQAERLVCAAYFSAS